MKTYLLLSLAGITSATAVSAQMPDPTKAYIDAGFAAMDANKDGKVDMAEFDGFMRARLARQAATFDAGFAALDSNSNGAISPAEAAKNPALAEHFADVDTNKDGGISKTELRAAMLAAQAQENGAN